MDQKRILGTSGLLQPDFNNFLEYSRLFFEIKQYSNAGPCVNLLEKRLAKFHECDHCITFSNGFWALVMTLECLKIKERCEVLMPSLTYRRLSDLVSWAGLTPVYYDIDVDSLTSSVSLVEKQISQNTSIVLGVHPIINCFPTSEVRNLCNDHGIPFIMDSVESAYEFNEAGRVGSQAVAEIFSLHASKLINACEGGYVATSDKDLAEKLKSLRGFGFSGHDIVKYDGGINSKLNEMHASLALANLDALPNFIKHNENIYRQYQIELSLIPGITLLEFDETHRTSFKNIVARIDNDFRFSRDELISSLNQDLIFARSYYYPALHEKNLKNVQFPFTEQCSKNHILLPSGFQIQEYDVIYICKKIKNLLNCKCQ